MSKPVRHIIVGAGITGLFNAWYALKKEEHVLILEKQDRPGGLIQTKHTDYGLVETAANAVMNSSLFEDLARELNIKLLPANKASRKRYIYCNDQFRRLPLNFFQKMRLLGGIMFNDARVRGSESLAEWGGRVLGKASIQNLMQPAFGGIYAGDVKNMNAALVLKNRVITKGSMIRQMVAGRKSKKKLKPEIKGLVSFEKGMGSLVEVLQKKILENANWQKCDIQSDISGIESRYKADKITICTGLQGCKTIVSKQYPVMNNICCDLETYNLVTVNRFGKKPLLSRPGFGVLFGPGGQIRARGILFNDHIFKNRVHGKYHSETFIYGGAFDLQINELDDDQIKAIVESDRQNLAQEVTKAEFVMIHRWNDALPAYNNELLLFNQKLDEVLPARWRVEGNFRYGIGLSSILERAAAL